MGRQLKGKVGKQQGKRRATRGEVNLQLMNVTVVQVAVLLQRGL